MPIRAIGTKSEDEECEFGLWRIRCRREGVSHVDPEVVLEIGKISPGGGGGYVPIEQEHETSAVVAKINLIGQRQIL